MTPDNTLIEWAEEEGFILLPLERALLVDVIKGTEVRGNTEFLSKTRHAPDVDGADYHTISAELLSRLILDEKVRRFIHPYGIRIVGAYIKGNLHLDTARISFPLIFQDCYIPEEIELRDANTQILNFKGSHTGRIRASRIVVESSLALNEGFWAKGEVRLHGAHIKGLFDCRRGRFDNPVTDECSNHVAEEHALMADAIKVNCDMYLTGVRARGLVSLGAARIYDNLSCEGARFINPKGKALSADRIYVGGNIYFSAIEVDNTHKAAPFISVGQVSLIQAKIKGGFLCHSALLWNKGQIALEAREAKIAGSVWFDGVKTNGLIRLTGSKIEGCLYFSNASFGGKGRTGLVGSDLNIKGRFEWTSIRQKGKTLELNLRYATVGQLQDDEDSWPTPGNLLLEGLEYKTLVTRLNTEKRKKWLDRQLTERLNVDDIENKKFGDLAKMISYSNDRISLRLRSRLLNEDIHKINANVRENGDPSKIDQNVILQGLNDLLQDEDLYKEFQTMGRSLSSKGQKFKEKLLEQKKKNGKEFVRQTLAHLNCEILKTVYEKLIEQKIKNKEEIEHQALAHLNCEILKTVYPQIKRKAKPLRRYFREQPYEQLASFLKSLGMDSEAKEILIAEHDAKLKYASLRWYTTLWLFMYKWTTKYGYKPSFAARGSMIFILFGGLVFISAYEEGLMVPAKEFVSINRPGTTGQADIDCRLSETFPEFDPFVYSLETFVPFLDLHQKEYWLPLSDSDSAQAHQLRSTMLNCRKIHPYYFSIYNYLIELKPHIHAILVKFPIRKDFILHLWMWFEIIMGWFLSTFFVAGVVGLMRNPHPKKYE